MMQKTEAIKILREAGIENPNRLVDLMKKTIKFLDLDLSNMVVLTEAASNFFVVTPIIAALSGSKRIIALTRDSQFAEAEAVISQTRALELLCDIPDTIEIHTDKPVSLFSEADIITNLGFVRPISADIIRTLKPTCVIPLMYESWELRPSDIDLEACRKRSIPVLGTNEDYPGLDVFSYSGWLCLKMLFEAQIEIHKSNILVVSSDKFGLVIKERFTKAEIEISLVKNLKEVDRNRIRSADVVIIADYTRSDFIIGDNGDISIADYLSLNPNASILQFAGRIDFAELMKNGIHVFPGIHLDSHRMTQTLAYLGPRPVIELHAGGLKVGEWAARMISSKRKINKKTIQENNLVQIV